MKSAGRFNCFSRFATWIEYKSCIKWIRLIDGKPRNDRSPLPNKPAFIALSCSAPLAPTPTDMLTVQITLPHSKAEIGLKWQVSEIPALAELLKVLAT